MPRGWLFSVFSITVFAQTAVSGVPSAPRDQPDPSAASSKPATIAAVPWQTLDAGQVAEDIALLRRALELIHPGLYRYSGKQELDAAFALLESRVPAITTDADLYREVSLMVAKIRCDHTKAEVPESIEKYRKEQPTFLPFRMKIIGGRMYVASCDPAQAVLRRGDEIISINGTPVTSLFATLRPAISVDGLTDEVKDAKLEADSDLLGCDFDHFYPFFFGFPSSWRLDVRPWSTAESDSSTRAEPQSVTMNPITMKQWNGLEWSSEPYRAEFHKSTTWKMLNEDTAYLRIDTFVNYRNPVPPASIYDPIFSAIAQAKASKLIIDLRENGGGSSDATLELCRYVLDKPFTWNKGLLLKAVRYGDLPRYIQSWGDPKELFEPPMENFVKQPDGFYEEKAALSPLERTEQQPSPRVFKGAVTVLTGPVNASGSTMLIAKLKDAANVRLVGSPTGGSAEGPTCGQLFFTKLPNSKVVVRIPNMWNRVQLDRFPSPAGVQTFQVGRGVAPDVLVEQSIADFVERRDTVLEAAMR
ncbi:MAG: S41 family peptidase [Phycisphaerales bacterium]